MSLALAAVMPALGHAVDVHVFLDDSLHALIGGRNPYGITFPNYYPPTEAGAYYGPGVVVGDRIVFGFPSGTLVAALPGYLLGDVRLSRLCWPSASSPCSWPARRATCARAPSRWAFVLRPFHAGRRRRLVD